MTDKIQVTKSQIFWAKLLAIPFMYYVYMKIPILFFTYI